MVEYSCNPCVQLGREPHSTLNYYNSSNQENQIFGHICSLGFVCAKYPLLTLAAVASLSVGLSYGLAFLRVTDNPLELWSNKLSRSRVEKDFYEESFGPFYRVAHVIITPTKQEVNEMYRRPQNSFYAWRLSWQAFPRDARRPRTNLLLQLPPLKWGQHSFAILSEEQATCFR